MKVLITGGSGFIGSHLADKLISRGDEVLVIDNFSTGRRDNLGEHDGLELVEGTIVDEKLMEKLFSRFKPDYVVHAAASYKHPENWEEDVKTNVLGTINVLRESEKSGVKRLIYYQTALQYGLKPVEQPITLNHPVVDGGSSYAISKTGGAKYIQLSNLNTIIFVLANAYGPRNISGPLPIFYSRLSSGKPCFVVDTRRDFIYVSNLIDISMMALDGKGESGTYHVSSGSDYSIKELYDATVDAMKISPESEVEIRPRKPNDTYTILIDPKKTNDDFGWSTTTPLTEGVRSAVEYYSEYGVAQTYTHLRVEEKK